MSTAPAAPAGSLVDSNYVVSRRYEVVAVTKAGASTSLPEFVVILDGRSTGPLTFDEMLGTVAKLALDARVKYSFRSPDDLRLQAARWGETSGSSADEIQANAERWIKEYFPK